jgi:hypothetical protein
MRKLPGGLVVLAAIGVLAPAQVASAAVDCTFSGSVITVELGADEDRPELSVSPAGGVVVSGTGVLNTCTALPETHKVSRIDVLQPGANQDSQPGIRTEVPFAPGAGDAAEGGGAPELEIRLDLGSGYDVPALMLSEGADAIRLGALAGGASGVNLNSGAEPVGPDGDDISMSGVDSLTIFAGSGGTGDVIDGRGGPEFAAPLPLPLSVGGTEGDDALSAGAVGAFLAGKGGDDTIRSGPGEDTLRGNAGRDTLTYDDAAGGVTVNLTDNGPQATGGAGVDTLDHAGDLAPDFEDLVGSPFADILLGSDAANRIVGGAGIDTIAALNGADDVRVDDAVPGDRADCGPGADSAAADALGTAPLDTLTNCEALALVDRTPPPTPAPEEPGPQPPAPGPLPAPGAGAVAALAPPPRAIPDTTPPRLRLSSHRRQKLGTLVVKVACLDEACTVRGSGSLRIAGRAKKQPLRARPIRLAGHGRGTLRFKLPGRAKKAARHALDGRRHVTATIAVSARDAGGNVTRRKRTIALK